MIHDVRTTSRKIGRRLALAEAMVYRRSQVLPSFRYCQLSGPEDPAFAGIDVDDSDWEVVEQDSYWSHRMTDFVLRTQFRVPDHWGSDGPIAIYLPLSHRGEYCRPETLAYIDGLPRAGVDGNHEEVLLAPEMCDGRPHLLALRGWTGRHRDAEPEPGKRPYLHACSLVQIHQPTREFVATARVALGVADTLDENAQARAYLLTALDEAFRLLELREPLGEDFYASVPGAHAALRSGIARAGQPIDVEILATGHSHLDVAWLWTLAQTRRKAGRTFHSVLRLMEQFPEYRFAQSQPQLYDYVRQDYPDLFDAIKERVQEGRWEALGGMWVEADCNISGPESLARQFLLGRTFFREHFGRDAESPVLWLPDVFGYAWQLPQLIQQAGLKYFFTVKLSWNRYNRIPYDSFWWQGLDGSRVLTHFSATPDQLPGTSTTYNAMATPRQTIETWQNFQQKELHGPLLMAYGYGDGGGGPTREMLENIRELGEFPGTPRLSQASVGDFFRQLETTEGDRLPLWNGELYFELHRGTYTTQGRNKQANRRSEFMLHDAEFLATLAAELDPSYAYPAEALRTAWQLVCLNQFHDIIPGSSIAPVYADSQAQYAQVAEIADLASASALEIIAGRIGEPAAVYLGEDPRLLFSQPTSELALATAAEALDPLGDAEQTVLAGAGGGETGSEKSNGRTLARQQGTGARPCRPVDFLLVNPASFARQDLVLWNGYLADGQALRRTDGLPVRAQATEDGTWLAAGDLQPYSVTGLQTVSAHALPRDGMHASGDESSQLGQVGVCVQRSAEGAVLENSYLRAEFDEAGDLVRLWDKEHRREVLAAGAVANQFQAFEDRPTDWDAWDLDIFYEDKMWLADPATSIEVLEEGPLHGCLEIRRRILHSDYVQRISLDFESRHLDFATTIDWREQHVLLKAAFPVDIFSPVATYEIQWGNLERPTHRNSSWDWARFEVCAQKWVDLSEGDYGVSLLNDCKYGHDIHDNTIRISLLRSPTAPDPTADQGEHSFTYSLLPHPGHVGSATVAAAYALNDPIIVYRPPATLNEEAAGDLVTPGTSFMSVDAENVVVETVKKAEEGEGIVVRLYESQRRRGRVTLTLAIPLEGAWRSNLLEEAQEKLEVAGNQVSFQIKPFEIVTLRLLPAC